MYFLIYITHVISYIIHILCRLWQLWMFQWRTKILDYEADYKRQVDALRNEVKEVTSSPCSSSSFLHLESSWQVDKGQGAILNNLRQQIDDKGGWQHQVFWYFKKLKTGNGILRDFSSCLFGQSLNDLFQGLDERQPSIAELVSQKDCNFILPHIWSMLIRRQILFQEFGGM